MMILRLNARQAPVVPLFCRGCCVALLTCVWLLPICGQSKANKKTPASKKVSATQQNGVPNELVIGSEGALPKDIAQIDLDQTASGRERLATLQSRGKEIFSEKTEIDEERLPLVRPRDTLVAESLAVRQRIVAANDFISREQKAMNGYKQLLAKGQNYADQVRQCDSNIFEARTQLAADQEILTNTVVKIDKLNAQIQPFEQKLSNLLVELIDSRKKWIEIRQPLAKYALGDYESLKSSLDEWLAFDTLWPDAHAWAALCAYELGDAETAWNHVYKAEEVRNMLNYPKAWPKGEALRGLIAAQLPDRRAKSAAYLQSAALFAAPVKSADWQVQFLIGRAGYESERTATKAKAGFTRALKINPDAAAVRYWNARLQTTSVTPAARDVEQGIKTLEQLWEQSPKKSWRLAQSLVLAYDAYDRQADAEQVWKKVLELAPQAEHEKLLKAREESREKQKTLTETEVKAKPQSDKSPKKSSE